MTSIFSAGRRGSCSIQSGVAGVAVRLVGVCMSGFDHESGVQTNLFCELDERGAASSEKRALSVAVDGVIERFGSSAVGYGRSMRFDHDVVRRDKYS